MGRWRFPGEQPTTALRPDQLVGGAPDANPHRMYVLALAISEWVTRGPQRTYDVTAGVVKVAQARIIHLGGHAPHCGGCHTALGSHFFCPTLSELGFYLPLRVPQSAAVLEVVHAYLGLVRSPYLVTALQVSSPEAVPHPE